jgi:ankyrin repeat protein
MILVAGTLGAVSFLSPLLSAPAMAQVAPNAMEVAAYAGLHRAAANGDVAQIKTLLAQGANPNARDSSGRTPLHVAAFGSHYDAVRALVAGGGDINALEHRRYDVITIAAVKNDVRMVKLALDLGGDPKLITSPYDGTALIAAAHLGHAEVVKALIAARAPLDHVNNLGWTALIESIVLGDGGKTHTDTLTALVKAGANVNLADRGGQTPLALARGRGYTAMAKVLEDADAR